MDLNERKNKKQNQKRKMGRNLNSLFWQHMLKGRACMHNNSGKSSNHSLESEI